MKKKLYFLTIIMCILGGFNLSNLNAQTTVTIGSGTESGYALADNYDGHGASQQIYTAEEIAAAGGSAGTITSIAFNKADGTDYDRTWSVYLKNINDASFPTPANPTNYAMTSEDLVYEGTFKTSNGWVVLDITDFQYDGRNLLVTVVDNSGGELYGGDQNWYYTFVGNIYSDCKCLTCYTASNIDITNQSGGFSAFAGRFNIQLTFEGGTAQPQPQIIEIGTQTGNIGELPTNIYYNYSLTQQIYTKTEIGKSKNGNITSIAFKEVSGYTTTRNIEIYMRNTTASSCTSSSEQMDIEERCWNGEVEFKANDWTTIKFQNPFEYEADKNIMLCVVDKTGSYSSGRKFAVYNTNDACYSFYAYNDPNPYTVNSNTYSYQSTPQKNCIKLEYEEAIELDPAIPTGLTAPAITSKTVDLSWNSAENAKSYNVYKNGELVLNVQGTSFKVEGLDSETEYCFTVTAVNVTKESNHSEKVCVTTSAPIRPDAPTNLAISVNGVAITLTWNKVANAESYNVYQDGTKISSGITSPTFTIGGLEENTRYCYTVTAVADLESEQSDYICAKTTEIGGEGETEEIAGNGSAYSTFLPIYSNGANKYSITQQYYTEDEINNAGGNITSISFCVYMANLSLTHNLEIYLNNVDVFGFEMDNMFQSPCRQVSTNDLVFKGNVQFPMTEGWVEINLDKPFLYTGNHILVTVVDNTPSTKNGIAFKARLSATVDGKNCVGYYTDDNMIDPTTNSYTMMAPANRNDIRFTFSAPASTIEFINDGDWNTASNWNTGIVPSATDDVIIKANATINGDVAVKHLSVEGGSLTIESGSLTVADIMVNNYAEDLIIEDSAQVFQTNDNVLATFLMNVENPTGELVKDNITGWQFISSPMKDAATAGFETEGGYDLFKYVGDIDTEDDLEWINYKGHKDTDFETKFKQGRGYMASYHAKNGIAEFVGELNNATNFSFDELTYHGDDHFANFYLLGNPFAFNMDWANVTAEGLASGYATVTLNGTYEYATDDSEIKVGDGFFVKVTGENPSLSYSENNGMGMRSRRAEKSSFINLIASGKAGSDNVIINFTDNDEEGFDKLENFNKDVAEIYVKEEGKRYGILNYDENIEEIDVYFNAKKIGYYTINAISNADFSNVTLIDRITGIETNILTNSYTFQATTNDSPERFIIRIDKETESENFVYKSGEELIINAKGCVQIIDVMGRIVYSNDIVNDNHRINISSFKNATYIVRVVNTNEVKTQKIVIW